MRKSVFIHRFRRGLRAAILASAALASSPSPARAAPEVVASILPLHSLTANLMRGVGEPALLLPAGQSPHGGQLKPSQVRRLGDADLVIWVGPSFEQSMAKVAGRSARAVALLQDDSILRLPVREGGLWEAHDGDEHDDHDGEHAHDDHDDHGDEHAHDDDHDAHREAHHGDHAGWRIDPHIWLSVQNARAIAGIVARELTAVDPANAARYETNRRALLARLADAKRALASQLGAVDDARYVVFHDAYHYFEHEFGLHPLGALTVSPERPPGAGRVRDIKRAIIGRAAKCVFSEPQFQPGLARTLAADTGATAGVLDPLGATLAPGPDAWFDLMRGLGDGLVECLK